MTIYQITPKLTDTQLMGLLSPIRKPETRFISHSAAKVCTFIKRVWVALRTLTFYSDKKIYDTLVTYSRQPNSQLPAVQSFFSPLQDRGFTSEQTELLKVNILGRAVNEALPNHYKNIFDKDRTFLEEILKLSISTHQKPLFESIIAFIKHVPGDRAIVLHAIHQALMSICSADQLFYIKPLLEQYKSDTLIGELLSNLGDIPHSDEIIRDLLTQISDRNECMASIQNLSKTAIGNKRWELAQHLLFSTLQPNERSEVLNVVSLEPSSNLSEFYAFLKNKNAETEAHEFIKILKDIEAIQDEEELNESTPTSVAKSWTTLEDSTVRQEFEWATKLSADEGLQMVELLKDTSTEPDDAMISQAIKHKMYHTANALFTHYGRDDLDLFANHILAEIPDSQEYLALQFIQLHPALLNTPATARIACQKGWSYVFNQISNDLTHGSSTGFSFLTYSESNFNPTIWNQLTDKNAAFKLPMQNDLLDIEQFKLYNRNLNLWKEGLNRPLQAGTSYFKESLKDYLNCCEEALKSQIIQKNGLPSTLAVQCFKRMKIGIKIGMTESQFKTTTDFLNHYVNALKSEHKSASFFLRLFVNDEKIKENAGLFTQLKNFKPIINFLPQEQQIELCVNCLKEVSFENEGFLKLLEEMQAYVDYAVFDESIKQICKEKPDFKSLLTGTDHHFKDLVSIRKGYFHELKNECIEKQRLLASISAPEDTQDGIAYLVEQHVLHLITSI